MVEVNTPHAHIRSRVGKDDAVDAEAAARKALSGEASTMPKDTTGAVEAIRTLKVARDSAVKARSSALVQLRDLLVTAPSELRESLKSKTLRGKASECSWFRPDRTRVHEPVHASKTALRTLARRIISLDEEISDLDSDLERLVADVAPTLIAQPGIGTLHAAQFLITAGQNIDRLHGEAAFARLCGVAPIPVSSGKTHRMRLHRGGDRQANRALYLICVCRMRHDQRTRAYIARRMAEGLSKKDAMRCIKRYIAREVFHALEADLTAP